GTVDERCALACRFADPGGGGMSTALKVMKYAFFDLLRSRWLIAYTLFFAVATAGLLYFGDDPVQAALSSLNLVLLVIPLVSLMLGMNYYYYTRDFVQ